MIAALKKKNETADIFNALLIYERLSRCNLLFRRGVYISSELQANERCIIYICDRFLYRNAQRLSPDFLLRSLNIYKNISAALCIFFPATFQ